MNLRLADVRDRAAREILERQLASQRRAALGRRREGPDVGWEEEARERGVDLHVLDGNWIAEHLAKSDAYWIAQQFLSLSADMPGDTPVESSETPWLSVILRARKSFENSRAERNYQLRFDGHELRKERRSLPRLHRVTEKSRLKCLV
jgi:hypothetical protein